MRKDMGEVRIGHPAWLEAAVDWQRTYRTDEDKVRLAISLARENVVHETGGPFGAAIVEGTTGRLVAVGVNSVVRLRNSVLHGEMIAFMMAQQRLQSPTLAAPGLPIHELATSSEPCAMCLGATLWSGVKRVVFGAERAHAENVGFDEGPVFPESYQYLRNRGIEIVGGVLREEARAVLELYRSRGGPIYNA
jgi:tRNA(Arg) A34 adenosine deaminase TadA